MTRNYVWIAHFIDPIDHQEKVRFISAISVYTAEIRAQRAFALRKGEVTCIGGYNSIDDARACAAILYPDLVEEEIA